MSTPKFMEFDEATMKMLAKANFELEFTDGEMLEWALKMARYQHQRDLVVMKKLWEIINTCKNGIIQELRDIGNNCACGADNEDTSDEVICSIHKTLARVETMLKELDI